MTRRTLAGLLAVPLLVALWAVAAFVPVPYVTYTPGITVDVLAENQGDEIVQVSGHKTYRDDGELRMTTVYVTEPRPAASVNIFEALRAWVSDEQAVYPYDAVYSEDETPADADAEAERAMVSSQDAAVAAALRALRIGFTEIVGVDAVTSGMPAEGKLQVGDRLLSIGGTAIRSRQDVVDAVAGAEPGSEIRFEIRRDGKRRTVLIVPVPVDGTPKVGITPGTLGFVFPFDVSVNISDRIGGPSAGLMFSLAIYDTLTPGSLTGGRIVAGTGTIDAEGMVGPIGGIQQKIVAAQEAQAELFLVPADNCAEALGAPDDGMLLVKATSMADARTSIETWVADPDATLPSCEEG